MRCAFFYSLARTLGLSLALGSSAFAEDSSVKSKVDPEYKNQFWSVGLGGQRYSYKAGDGFELLGNSGAFSLGYGYTQNRWYVLLGGDFLVGPFKPRLLPAPAIDYQGTRVSAWWGYSAQELNLRHPEGGYGFAFGLSYTDMTGRSVSSKTLQSAPLFASQDGLIYHYHAGITNFSLAPGIFFCWMEPPRTYGSSADQLKTRTEGYILTLAFSIPIFSSYRSHFSRWKIQDSESFFEREDRIEIPASAWASERLQASGSLKGYSLLISLQALIGA